MSQEEWELIAKNCSPENQRKFIDKFFETFRGRVMLLEAHAENLLRQIRGS